MEYWAVERVDSGSSRYSFEADVQLIKSSGDSQDMIRALFSIIKRVLPRGQCSVRVKVGESTFISGNSYCKPFSRLFIEDIYDVLKDNKFQLIVYGFNNLGIL